MNRYLSGEPFAGKAPLEYLIHKRQVFPLAGHPLGSAVNWENPRVHHRKLRIRMSMSLFSPANQDVTGFIGGVTCESRCDRIHRRGHAGAELWHWFRVDARGSVSDIVIDASCYCFVLRRFVWFTGQTFINCYLPGEPVAGKAPLEHLDAQEASVSPGWASAGQGRELGKSTGASP